MVMNGPPDSFSPPVSFSRRLSTPQCVSKTCTLDAYVECQKCGTSLCATCMDLPPDPRGRGGGGGGCAHSWIDLEPQKQPRHTPTGGRPKVTREEMLLLTSPEEISLLPLDNPSPIRAHSKDDSGDFSSIKFQDDCRSVLLVDSDEKVTFNSCVDLAAAIGCEPTSLVKVVSIFGNTGDGKSHTLNHTFFNGSEVFKTSQSQEVGTVGVWAAYDPDNRTVVLDTEGLLGVSTNQNRRSRLLVKIFAISDIIIYRTRSDRLHSDIFQFLGDASAAYLKYFTSELRALSEASKIPVSHLGPSLVLFHETQFTEPLAPGSQSTTEQLKARFADLGRSHEGFSAIHYIGVRTVTPPTDFSGLREEVVAEIGKTHVRSSRSLQVVFQALITLNHKFNGRVDSNIVNSLPDEYFTCGVACMACKSKCSLSMNHSKSGKGHFSDRRCHYEEQYQNRVFNCKKCWAVRGEERVVIPKTTQSGDSVWTGLAKYAWKGYVLECPVCGLIYNSRAHWYGNKSPEEESVRVEIAHVWPGANQVFQDSHNACRQLVDGLSSVAGSVASLTAGPTRLVSDWASDQVAPSYWVPNAEIKECHQCQLRFSRSESPAAEHQQSKHHCRACGQGFCDSCSSYSMPVPWRGWGEEPVRVCFSCFNSSKSSPAEGPQATSAAQPPPDASALNPRKLVEGVRQTVSYLSPAVEMPKSTILQFSRPAYWVEDAKITSCYCCESAFDWKLQLHHCRACGNGVCDSCSAARMPVPVRGWDYPVRVCDMCNPTR